MPDIEKRFRLHVDYNRDELIRDLQLMVDELNTELQILRDRLTAGGL